MADQYAGNELDCKKWAGSDHGEEVHGDHKCGCVQESKMWMVAENVNIKEVVLKKRVKLAVGCVQEPKKWIVAEEFHTKADIYYFQTCSKKYNLTVPTVTNYYYAMIRSVENVNLFSECYFRGMGYIDKKGNILYSKLKNVRYLLFSLEKSGHIIDRCTTTNGDTVGEKVSILMECVVKEMYKVWIVVYNNQRKLTQQWAIKTCAERNNLPILKLEEYFKILPANGQMIQIISECYLLEQNYLSDEGNLISNKFKNRHTLPADPKPFFLAVDQCNSERGTTVAETSYKLLNCLFNRTKIQQEQELENHQRAMVVCARKYQLPIHNLHDYIDATSKCDYQLKLYSKCYLTELGYVDNTGKILYDHIKNISTPDISLEQYSNFVTLCKNEQGDNITETSYKFLKCFLFNIHKVHSSHLTHTKGQQRRDKNQRQIEHVQQKFEKKHVQLDQYRQLVKQHEVTIDLLQYQLSQLQELPKITKEQHKLLEPQDKLQIDFKRQFQKQKEEYQQILQQIQTENQQLQQLIKEDRAKYESLQEILCQQLRMIRRLRKSQLALKICSATCNFLIQTISDYDKAIIAESPQVKLFSECYLRELGYLDNTGTILYEKVKEATVDSISDEQYSEIVGMCQSVIENEVVEKPYKFSKCVLLKINNNYRQQRIDLQLQQQQKQLALLRICAKRLPYKKSIGKQIINIIVSMSKVVLSFKLKKLLKGIAVGKCSKDSERSSQKWNEQHWTKAIDLKSAVERLYEKLGALEFDADHEGIYGMERYYTVQQCEELQDKYKIGMKVCRKFLKEKTCYQCLMKRISKIGLRQFLTTINKYIKDCSNSDTSSSSDEEECKAVKQNGEDSKTTEEEE
ncbi:hypothetical protein FQA39_LY15826 [Lamprigera yunnana]|nr:hypothetical protein FQA39_LY15826 [Lamprigera yunnana]